MRLRDTVPTSGYPFDLPAVLGAEDVRLGPVTVLVGENGSGKSTLVEAIAVAAGFNAEGDRQGLQFETFSTHSALADHLQLGWAKRPSWGWFLRAETFYGMASHIATDDDPRYGIAKMFPDLHGRWAGLHRRHRGKQERADGVEPALQRFRAQHSCARNRGIECQQRGF